jgi:putative membrane protein
MLLAASALPRWQPHVEIWVLIAGLLGLGWYAARVVQPLAVAQGGKPITRRQKWFFGVAVLLLWVASDWPMHDVAEQRLYFVHMIQHLLYSAVIAPMLLLATPEWLARLLIGEGRVKRFTMTMTRPIQAALLYNIVTAVTHIQGVVNASIVNGPLHYFLHILVVGSALLAWMPVCGPLPERRISPAGQMIYIFLLSVIPTVPSAFLTASDGVLYKGYDHEPRLWGISVISDQQLAGVMMKVTAGFYLWAIILVIFLRWSRSETGTQKYRGTLVPTVRSSGLPAETPGRE